MSFWEYNGDKYFMLVNKRTPVADTSKINIYLEGPGRWIVREIDSIAIQTDTTWDSLGLAPFLTALPPGSGKLYRVENKNAWSGTLSQSMSVPQYATLSLTGNLTVDSGFTLALGKGSRVISTSSLDISLTIKGELSAVGSVADSVKFISTTDTMNSWHGISVINYGSSDIRYSVIDNAYIGYKNESADTLSLDTLMDVRFTDFYAQGACLSSQYIAAARLAFESDGHPAYGLRLEGITNAISDCTFDSVAYAVYVYTGSPTLSGFVIYYGHTGIKVSAWPSTDTTRIEQCYLFNQSGASILVGNDHSHITVDTCYLYNIDALGLANIFPDAFCRAAGNLFDNPGGQGSSIFVYSKSGNIDLGGGAASSPGRNWFTNHGNYPYPAEGGHYLYNSGQNTTYAKFCCWADTTGDYTYGDYSWKYLVHKCDTTVVADLANKYCNLDPEKVIDTVFSHPVIDEFDIAQNFPNPSNPATSIKYKIPYSCDVSIVIYNILGQAVRVLVDAFHDPGEYTVIWDGKDRLGMDVASGIYFYQMVAGDFATTKKLMLLK